MTRTPWLYISLLLFLAFNCPSITAEELPSLHQKDDLFKRTALPLAAISTQDDAQNSGSVTSVEASPGPTSLASTAASSFVTSGSKSTTLVSSTTKKDASPSTSGLTVISGTPIANSTMNITGTAIPVIEGLPVQPTITPAFSVAGALMILAGTLYALIGIKTKWLHVFLSAMYIFALAVTILIIYVMHPPVSNGIEGAYFVAVAATGIVAGAVAVLFADVTEGLGCLLGGFCLSMWFMVLKPGGILTSTAGKAIFIACFTIGAFSLYLSHYTRPYGLIGSTSFAGATIVLLGVDMFSRAGLKEFWVYIWGLNSDMWPQNYAGPYPITRGMRVEIAGIVILFLLGIMSQMKVWKIVRQKRQDKAVEQLRKDAERDLAEEDLGKRLEAGNERDRTMWDAVYGGKIKSKLSGIDSGIGTDEPSSTRKGSLNMVDVREVPEGMELQNFQGTQDASQQGGRLMVHVAQDDIISETPRTDAQHSTESLPRTSGQSTFHESRVGGPRPAISNKSSARSLNQNLPTTLDPALTLKPKYVPLPFHIPRASLRLDDDEVSSVAADAASGSDPAEKRNSRPRSSLLRKLSGRSQPGQVAATASQEALVSPSVADDCASSVAATMDGVSAHMSPRDCDSRLSTTADGHRQVPGQRLSNGAAGSDYGKTEAHDIENPNADNNQATGLADPLEAVPKTGSEYQAIGGNLSEHLPEGASKVIMAYRTNEWAKHLDRADSPQFDQIPLMKSRPSHSNASSENVAHVNVKALRQTPLTAEPAPVSRSSSSDSGTSGSQTQHPTLAKQASATFKEENRSQPPSPVSRQHSALSPLGISMGRTPSQTSLSSTQSREETSRASLPVTRSQASLVPPRGFRSSSSPLSGTPLVESPIEEGVESKFPQRFTPSTTHLMSQRDSRLQSRASSTSLLRISSAGPSTSALQTLDEDDNIPLSQRRSILQQNSQSNPQSRHTSSGNITPHRISRNASGSNTPQLVENSHNTSRISLAPTNPPHVARPAAAPRNSSTVSAWHASLQPNTQAVYQHQEIEQRRADLLAEKRRQSSCQTQAQIAQGRRESVLDRGMRRGSMLDAHREAMRKMQGEANKTLKTGP